MIKILTCCLLIVTVLSTFQEAPYAEWAHSHVVWVNGREQNQKNVIEMVDQYLARNISVGGVLIDSAWSTEFNNFVWNTKKFPQPQEMIDYFHSKGMRVLLWTTSLVNNDSSLYEEGKKNKYFLNNGKLAKWWHGKGAFIDYFNPAARQWWHKQLDKVIEMGIDGWKCDGADPIIALLRPWPYSSHAKRYITLHEYGHRYYGDFYNYTKSKNPDALIMARPTDTFQTASSWNYAPKYVMFSGWVGDQDSSSSGFQKAIYNVLKSAWNGYLNFGFDIGGYRGQNISKNIFIRWVQAGALVPYMENGGNGKHRPWVFDDQTVDIYRKFVNLHYELKPHFLTTGKNKYHQKKSAITPLAEKIPQTSTKLPSTFSYLLGENLLVSPVFEENGQAQVQFPSESNWVYFFKTSKVMKGGQSAYYSFSLDETPLFMRTNSVIPFQSELKVVAVKNGFSFSESILYGGYSDDVKIEYKNEKFTISVQRFNKSEVESESESESEAKLKVRLIGYQKVEGQELEGSEQVIEVTADGTAQVFGNYRLMPEYSRLEESNFVTM